MGNNSFPEQNQEKKPDTQVFDIQELEKEIIAENPKIFEGIKKEKKHELLKLFYSQISIQQKTHSGPLPDPETLVQYNSIIPNGADRIMTMAEKQQDHRIDIEKAVITSQNRQSQLGQIFGLVIGLFGIVCGTFLAYKGETVVGSIIAGGTVVSLVSVFVIGKRKQKKE